MILSLSPPLSLQFFGRLVFVLVGVASCSDSDEQHSQNDMLTIYFFDVVISHSIIMTFIRTIFLRVTRNAIMIDLFGSLIANAKQSYVSYIHISDMFSVYDPRGKT